MAVDLGKCLQTTIMIGLLDFVLVELQDTAILGLGIPLSGVCLPIVSLFASVVRFTDENAGVPLLPVTKQSREM